MNGVLLRHVLRAQSVKLLVVCLGLACWDALMPIVYEAFGVQFRALLASGAIPSQFAEFGGGDVFSLSGAIALGFIHPIAIILVGVFAVGLAAGAVAGERQRGTLEVLLARPISRRAVYLTHLTATLVLVGIALAAALAGALTSSTLLGISGQLKLANVPFLWLNAWLLWGALAAIALGASVSFDRLTPALGVALAVTVVEYFLEVLGSLWPAAKGLQPYSLFHYLDPKLLLNAGPDPGHAALLAVVAALAVGYALVVFPRRDLAAPS